MTDTHSGEFPLSAMEEIDEGADWLTWFDCAPPVVPMEMEPESGAPAVPPMHTEDDLREAGWIDNDGGADWLTWFDYPGDETAPPEVPEELIWILDDPSGGDHE